MTSTHPKSESALLLAMANAQTTDEQRQIAAELETVRRAKRTQDEADRMSSLSLAALAFPDSDTERHTSTASSDWLGDIEVPQVDRTEMENQMRAQATVWLQGRPAEVRADGEEFRTQAASKAHYLSNHFPGHREAAAEAFLDQIRTLAVEDWARADDDAVSVSDADQHEKVEFEGATADEEAETSASDSPSLAEGTEPEGDTPMDDSDPAWQGKNHDDSTFNREDAGQTVARRKQAASTHNLSVGDRVMLTQDGKEREFEVTFVSPSGSTGRAESAGPRVTVTLVGGKGYSVSFDNHSQPGISSWSKVSARKTAATVTDPSSLKAGDVVSFGSGDSAHSGPLVKDEDGNLGVEGPGEGEWTGVVAYRDGKASWNAVSEVRTGSRKTASRQILANHNGWTNWDTWSVVALLDNASPEITDRGQAATSVQALKDVYDSIPAHLKSDVDMGAVNWQEILDTWAGDEEYTASRRSASRKEYVVTMRTQQGEVTYHIRAASEEQAWARARTLAEVNSYLIKSVEGTGDSHNDVYPGKAKESSRKMAALYEITIEGVDENGDEFSVTNEFEADSAADAKAQAKERYGDGLSEVKIHPSKKVSRKTAISLSNVGVESDTVGTGTDPSGKKVRFSITPAEAKQLKDILFSDLAVNFSGVDVEESDIIKEGAGPRRQAALTPVSELTPGDVIDPWGDGPSRVMNMKPGEFHPGMDVTLRLNDGREITHPFDSTEKVKKVATRTATEGRKAASRAGDDFSWAFDKEGGRTPFGRSRRSATWEGNGKMFSDECMENGVGCDGSTDEGSCDCGCHSTDDDLQTDGDVIEWHADDPNGYTREIGSKISSRRTASHYAVDQADKPCASCGRPVGWLEVFPNFGGEGILCIDCYSRTPEGRRMPTSDELTRMWGGPVRQGSRKQASAWAYVEGYEEQEKVNGTGQSLGNPYLDGTDAALAYRDGKADARVSNPPKWTRADVEDDDEDFGWFPGSDRDPSEMMTGSRRMTQSGGRNPSVRSPRRAQATVGSRKTAREAMVCETCGKEVEHADWDRCPHCGSSAGAEWETVASRRKTARSWIYSLKQIVESGQDGQIDGLPVGVELATGIVQATQTEGGRALLDRPFHEVYDMAVKAFAGAVFSSKRESSRRNHPSAGVDFSWAFANSKNSRKVQK